MLQPYPSDIFALFSSVIISLTEIIYFLSNRREPMFLFFKINFYILY